jgi:flagellar basal-body rod protein FlgF
MENSLLIGLSRQVVLERQLDVVANNIANINTTGFKADNSSFQEYLMPVARENRFNLPDRQLSFVHDRGVWHDLRQGSIQRTGNPLDLAIENNNAFLVVRTPAGERYTRNGALQINSQGQIVTADGSIVLGENGPIVIQALDHDLAISPDGRITVIEGNNNRTESMRGRLRLVSFGAPQQLQKDGANNFLAPTGLVPQPVGSNDIRVVSGSVEKSNVNGITEMTRLIDITRTYQQIANMLQAQGDLRRNAIDKLADVPA